MWSSFRKNLEEDNEPRKEISIAWNSFWTELRIIRLDEAVQIEWKTEERVVVSFYFVYFSRWLYIWCKRYYVTLSSVISYARHARSIIDNYARVGCHVSTYIYVRSRFKHQGKIIIFHMTTDKGRLKLQFRDCTILSRTGVG